jgi:hypothetical protein
MTDSNILFIADLICVICCQRFIFRPTFVPRQNREPNAALPRGSNTEPTSSPAGTVDEHGEEGSRDQEVKGSNHEEGAAGQIGEEPANTPLKKRKSKKKAYMPTIEEDPEHR